MPDQLPAGFRFLDEEAPAPAASAPSLPAGFRFLDEPAPDSVPLPPPRPAGLGADVTPPVRPPEFGTVNDDAGVGAPTPPAPANTGGVLDSVLGDAGKLTPEQGRLEQAEKAAQAVKDLQAARDNAARQKAAPPQIPTFSDGPPAQESEADVADQMAQGAFSNATKAVTAPPPTLTPGRAAVQSGINAAGKAATGMAKPVGQMNADLGAPQIKNAITGADQAIDKAFPQDPGRSGETGQAVAEGLGGLVPFIAGGAIAKGLGLSAEGVTAAIGALQGGGQGYEAAEAAGAGPMARYLSMFGNAGIGAAQAVPYMRMLDRIESMAPGSITGILKQGTQTSIEQVAIQGLSKVGENGLAKLLYDKDQGLFDGVVQSAQVAAIVGGMLGMGGGVAAFANPGARQALADRLKASTPAEIDAFLGTVKGKDSRAEIDDFIKNKDAADAAKEAPSAPALPAPGADSPPVKRVDENNSTAPSPLSPEGNTSRTAPEINNTPQPGDATLKAMGYGDEEIALMSPRERAAELEAAKQAGIAVDEGDHTATPAAEGGATSESGTRAAPVKVDQGGDIEEARGKVATAPTPAQIEAGNYAKGHITFDGLPISIENPKGSTRSGTAPDGTPWQATLPADYGYIKGSKGADGDHVDAFIGDKPPNGRAFVIDQHDPSTGRFDEHKVVLGVDSAGEAARLYNQAFSDGKGTARIGGITEVPVDSLKEWLANGEQKTPIGSTAPIQLPPGFKELVITQDHAPKPAPEAKPVDLKVNKPAPADTTGDTTPTAKPVSQENLAPATPAKPRPRTGPPQTLVSFLKQNGGIKDSGGELRARDLHKRFPGLVNNKSGRPLDDARLIAAEAGYLGHDTEDAMAGTFIDDLLNKIDQHPTYSAHDEKELVEHQVREGLKAQRDADLGQAEDDVHADMVDAGIPEHHITFEHLREAARLVVDEGVPVQDAYERAVMSATLKEEGPEARDLDADIPWDDYEPTAETETPRADQGRQEGEGGSPAHLEEGARAGAQVGEEGRGNERPEEARTPESAGEGSPRGVETPSAPREEAGADGKPQLVLAGAERIGDGELAQRKADEGLKPKKAQKDADGLALFGDGHKQTDLLDKPAPVVEAPPAGQKSLSPFDASKSVADAVADYLYRGEAFTDIRAARKFVAEHGGKDLNQKQIEEAIEHGVVKAARAIVAESKTPAETYDRLVALYANQPRLGTRTSTSVEQQAYSTPAPLAYIASELAGITKETSVYEPTAGNGMLLIGANPRHTVLNELNPDRAAALREQGFRQVTTLDASEPRNGPPLVRSSAVIANPPFGVVKDDIGETKRFDMGDIQPGYRTGEIDHVISLRALDQLGDDGRAVLILGGINKMARSEDQRSDAYNGKAKREFFHVLYNRYNVTDHFTVAGELYEKQGAGYPIDVIAINGRGKSARALPSVDVPPVLRSWDELKEKLNGAQPGPATPRAEDNRAADVAPAASEPAGPRAVDAEHPADAGRLGPPAEHPAEGSRGLRDGRDRLEPGNAGTAGEPSRPELRPDDVRDAGRPGELAASRGNDGLAPAPTRQEQETEGQAAYRPKSEKAQGLGTLVPKNMRRATEEALAKVGKSKGSVDELVASALGMKPGELSKFFAAEQVDALALAIHNLEKGSGFIIGDQTGIGKGRVNAAIIRYALHNQFTPIFVTEKPNLYADMYRDLKDIGIVDYLGREPRIQMTNTGERIPLDEEGKLSLKTPDAKTHNADLLKMGELGVLPKHDMLFTTYNQMQTVKGNSTPRQAALRGLISNAILILDEAHNAGGTEAGMIKPKGLSRSDFARQLVSQAKGVFYSSATYAKRPSVMDLYSKTDMAKAVDKPSDLAPAIATGGVPMQQVVASMLAEAGQYIRRERSFAGVTYEAKVVPVDRKSYEDFSSGIAAIFKFSGIMKEAAKNIDKELKSEAKRITPDGSTGGAGAQSTNFTSTMHNLVNQVLLAQKAGPATQMALEALKEGKKPVLTVANTMESFLQEYVEDHGVRPNDPVTLNFRDLLTRYLERTRTVLIKQPFSKESGEKRYLTNAELGPIGVSLYKAAQKAIERADLGSLPVSPIDYMRDELARAGFNVAEITGRGSGISYADPETPRYYVRSGKETSIAGRRKAINDFNGGEAHAMVLNQAGATGLSLHASEKVKDQRRRHMILVQPEANVDTHMQMLGRVHRTGQVITPEYSQLVADIPAEKRPAAILAKKMASLNASTTAAREGALTADNVVDFMNEYGDEVAHAIMYENPEINRMLGDPVDMEASTASDREGAMRKLTGRIPLLPIKKQEELYGTLERAYTNLIAEKEAAGENALEAKRLDLDAKVLSSAVIREGKGDSPFTQPVRLETLDVKRQGKPYTAANLIEDAAKAVEVKPHSEPTTALDQIQAAGVKKNDLQVRAAFDAFRPYAKELLGEIENPTTRAALQARLDDNEKRFGNLMHVARVGHQVSIVTDDQRFSGIITNVYRDGEAQNPLALGTWKVKLAIPGKGQVPFPFSKLYTDVKPAGKDDVTFYRLEASLPDSNVLTHFDEMSKDAREQRMMLTGNLLAAYAHTRGQIVHFTDHEGGVRQGVLLSSVMKSAADVMRGKGIPLKGGQAVMDELNARGPGVPLSAANEPNVAVSLDNRGALIVSVPGSKSQGGKYFLNRDIRDAAGSDFIKRGGVMRLEVPRYREREKVLEALMAAGVKFEKLPEEAETKHARVDNGPRPTLTPELAKIVRDALHAAGVAQRVAGKHATVDIAESIPITAEQARSSGSSGEGEEHALGLYDQETKLIQIALGSSEEARVAHHEAFHALEDVDIFHAHEKAVLNRELPRMRQIVAREYNYSPETVARMPDYEIRAYAYEKYANDKESGMFNAGDGMHIGLRRIFDKVFDFFRRLRNMLHGAGFRHADDVFEHVRTGEMAERDAGPNAGGLGGKFARVKKPGERRYFDDESFTERLKRRLSNGFKPDRLEENFLDLSAPVRRMQEEIKEQGHEIGPGKDLYKAKRLYGGKVAARSADFDRDYVKPLAAEAKEAGLTRQDIAEYMFARHAPERNQRMDEVDPNNNGRGSGITNDQAQKILDRFQNEGKLDALRAIEHRVDAIREFELRTLNEAGLISDAQADAWRDMYQHYAPLRGWEDPDLVPDGVYMHEGRKLSIKGAEAKHAFGRKSISDDPLANLIHQAHRAIDRAERNAALKTGWRLFNSIPKDDREEFVKLDKGKQMKVIDQATGQVRYVPEPGWQHREDAVALKIGGQPHYMVFNDVHMAQAIKRLHPDQLPLVLKPMATLINFAKSMWTHYSPEFVVRHFFMRYPVEAALNAGEDGLGAMLRSAKGYPGGSAFRGLLKADAMTSSERATLAQKVATGTATKAEQMQHYYHEMRAAGGMMKFADIAGIEQVKKRLDTALARTDQNPLKRAIAVARAAHEFVDYITNALDNAQRLSAYVEARQRGETPSDAAMKAREATIDFGLRGRFSRYVNLLWPFGNTAAQTSARAVKAVRRSSNMRKVVAGVFAMGAAQALYNYLYGGNDKDGKPFFEKVPEWTRRLSMVVMSPFHDSKGRPYWAQISLPYNYAFPFTAGSAAMQLALKPAGISKESTGAILHNVMHSALEALTPMAQENSLVGKFVPEVLRPGLHVAMNENFAGNPVHSKDPRKGIAHAEQGFRSTPEHWKTLAGAVNRMTGGSRYESGAIDLYPEDYRQVLGYTTDTLERTLVRGAHAVSAAKSGKVPDVGDIPVVRAGVGGDHSYDMADRSAYYEERQKAFDAEAAYKKARKENPAEAQRIMKEHREDISNAHAFRQADGQRGGLYKQMDALHANKTMSSDEVDTRTKALEEREIAIMNRVRGMVERRRPAP